MKRMETILTEFANSKFTVDELILMFDDFTFDSETVFFAIGMFMKTKEIKEFNNKTDITTTSI